VKSLDELDSRSHHITERASLLRTYAETLHIRARQVCAVSARLRSTHRGLRQAARDREVEQWLRRLTGELPT
jgi:hypothetical protein